MVLWGGAGGWYLYYTNKTKCRLSPGCCLSSGEPSLCQEKQRLAYPMLLICVEVKMQCRFSNMERLVLNIGHARSGRSDVLFFFFLQIQSQMSPMSIWLPAIGQREQRTIENSVLSVGLICFSLYCSWNTMWAAVPVGSVQLAKSYSSSSPLQMQLLEGRTLNSICWRGEKSRSQNELQRPAPELMQM